MILVAKSEDSDQTVWITNVSVSEEGKLWTDTADGQADLSPFCPHVPEDTYLHGVAHVIILKLETVLFFVCVFFFSTICYPKIAKYH